MDHFCGFDHLVRVCLGRDAGVSLYGPPGFIAQLEHKLAAYTWNLVENYETDFVVVANQLDAGGRVQRARFRSRCRFQREPMPDAFAHGGVLRLTELKKQVRAGAPDATPIQVRWRTREGQREQTFALGQLKREVLDFVPGQKVCYVTDVSERERNIKALLEFVRHADLLFIEAVFLDADRELAKRKAHLTARCAGEIARTAGVKSAVPFHFSPRYMGREDELRCEFAVTWPAIQST